MTDDCALPNAMQVDEASRKLRIAFVYNRLPFPMMRGDQLTVAHLLEFLGARGHIVELFTLDNGGHLSKAQETWLNDVCNEVHIYRHGPLAKGFGMMQGLFSGKPLQVGIFMNAALKKDLHRGLAKGQYDVVYIYYLRSAEALPKEFNNAKRLQREGGGAVAFLAMQLSQTLNYERIHRNEKSMVKKLLYKVESNLLRRYEARIWQKFTRTVLIGPNDVDAIKAECRRYNVREIDNWVFGAHGTDVNRFTPAKPFEVVPGRIVFSGSMHYTPNIQAILWFVEKCWPEVRGQVPSAELVVQGRDPSPVICKLHGKNGISVTGTVPDVGAMIRSASVCINPMLAAGGMQNKLIEYFASGKAVVATSVANEGIGAVPGEHFLLADSHEEFSSATVLLLEDEAVRKRLEYACRNYVLKNWTWEAHFMQLENNFYDALLQDSAAVGSLTSEATFPEQSVSL